MYTYIHTYIYTHIHHIYIYIYIYTYTHTHTYSIHICEAQRGQDRRLRAVGAVDFRKLIVLFWAETLAH